MPGDDDPAVGGHHVYFVEREAEIKGSMREAVLANLPPYTVCGLRQDVMPGGAR